MTNAAPTSTEEESLARLRWLHGWAVFMVCATVVLLALGAVVTTFRVGMVDPIWPTYPWHLLLVSWDEPKPGFLIEHGHRLAAYMVGLCAIFQVGFAWRSHNRRLAVLSVVILLAVIVQGMLGGFRVRLDRLLGPDLAFIHGCFASIVFSLLMSMAVLTSRGWRSAGQDGMLDSPRLRRWTLLTAGLIFLQLIFGGLVRHTYSALGQRGHLFVAFAVVAAVVWLQKLVADQGEQGRGVARTAFILAVLVACQVLLGVEAWLIRFLEGSSLAWQASVRTAHFVLGSSIFATAVAVAVQAHRNWAWSPVFSAGPVRQLEGVA